MKFFERYPIFMIGIGVIGISLSAIFVRFSSAPSSVTAAYRLIWTVILMTPFVFKNTETRKELLSVSKSTLLYSALSGIFLAIHFCTWFESLHHTSVASSTILVDTEVIWVAIGFCLFLKGKLHRLEVLAIAVTMLGSLMIAFSDHSGGNGVYGDFLAIFAAIAVAIYTLFGRKVRSSGTSTSVYTYIVYIFCALALWGTTLVQGYGLFDFGIRNLLIGLGLAVFPTILGHSIFSWCLKYFSPTFVSASKLCEPVLSTIMATFLFAEIPSPLQLLGGVIIIAGVVGYSFVELKKKD